MNESTGPYLAVSEELVEFLTTPWLSFAVKFCTQCLEPQFTVLWVDKNSIICMIGMGIPKSLQRLDQG
jgi:hypothetical protein